MEKIEILYQLKALMKQYCKSEDMSELLYKHRCYYLVDILGDGKYRQNAILQKNLNELVVSERYKQCRQVFEELNGIIRYATIKGGVLSLDVYGNTGYRCSTDIDILIDPKDILKVKNILFKNGFIQGNIEGELLKPYSREDILFYITFSHQMAPFVKKTQSKLCPFVIIDVNTDIMWGESTQKLDMNFVLSNIQKTNFEGITLYKFNNEMNFISLCLHHYKDLNSIYILVKKPILLYYFCDIYFYYINNEISINEMIYMSNRLGVLKYIYYCIYYTYQVFKDDKLLELLEVLKPMHDPTIINTFGLSQNEIKNWKIGFYERLFGNLSVYFRKNLTKEDWDKIEQNNKHII